MSAIRTLLRESIDYAGLFPPAGLDMDPAVANYARYRSGAEAWALGRFILPVSRLPEFELAQHYLPRSPASPPWRLATLAGSDLAADLQRLAEFNRRHTEPGRAAVVADTVEVKAGSAAAIEEIMRRVPAGLQVYIEVPVDHDPSELIASIGRLGGRAKVRTGGVRSDAFPTTDELMRFIGECVHKQVAFKATAGLHHPLRAEYRLTYDDDSPRGTMFGFLNLLLTAAFLRQGMVQREAARVLEEGSPGAFHFEDGGMRWRDHSLSLEALAAARRQAMTSFGSCSFTEPIADLESLKLLEPRVQRA